MASEVERKLPWLIDIFLYPMSTSGIIHLVIFLLAPFVISLIHRFILGWVWPVGEVMALLLYLLYVGYVFFYLGYCIFDSSKGGVRAPDISMEPTPDKWDFVSQLVLITGIVAVCFWPVAVYYILTKRVDLTFWLLSAAGAFFFPMALLAGVLFDAIHALNPIFIISSIFKTFLPYCRLILSLCIFGGLVALIFWILRRVPVPEIVSDAVGLYLLFVAAHILGSFYWWHKDKLDWGI